MVKIRLQRAGAKKRPFYRVVAIDERRQRDGRALEFLGTYNPLPTPPQIRIASERIEAWRRQGAQVSGAVASLLRRAKKLAPAAGGPA
jgi:small subunit ribosomal protein S16